MRRDIVQSRLSDAIERFHVTSQSRENHAIRHVGVQLAIVLYVVVCRSKRSGRNKDASFYIQDSQDCYPQG